ncbi:DUF4249 domain-containing protein [Rhodocytophaga aerolata]|uniref:DUF4249 domain-containing protein n=1 Tax=Rhodocytophaga aerolata TaxID=455078 RepID=A0ABT8QYX4_9BACT|nr:DUF4249 domain-containing protein [Rhodocytophaga aerolata]MDO1444874.1 DUF4249 domain-containing protein [Rhodocytophaga aerolata]
MKTINIYIFAGLLFLLSACQEVIEVPLDNTNPKLVVEGAITNQPGPYYVKLSQTGDFYSTAPAPKVTDAVVTISDDAGNSEVLTHLSDQPGTYATSSLQGETGRTYTLTIVHEGQNYQAQSKLLPVTNIDKLEVRFVPESPTKDEGYYIYFFAKEPQGETNYYRFMVYENDSLYNSINDLLVSNDDFIKGDIENLELGYAFQLNDEVKLEMHSISKEVYDYYIGLINIYNNDGGLFSPPPVNPPSNISNGALGVFRASSVVSQTVTITGEE